MFPANDNYIVIEGFCGELLIDVAGRQVMGKAAGFIQKAGVYEKKAPGFIQKAGVYEKKAAGFGQNPAPFVCPAVYFLQAKQENQKKL
jgi:hypothetical protein